MKIDHYSGYSLIDKKMSQPEYIIRENELMLYSCLRL